MWNSDTDFSTPKQHELYQERERKRKKKRGNHGENENRGEREESEESAHKILTRHDLFEYAKSRAPIQASALLSISLLVVCLLFSLPSHVAAYQFWVLLLHSTHLLILPTLFLFFFFKPISYTLIFPGF